MIGECVRLGAQRHCACDASGRWRADHATVMADLFPLGLAVATLTILSLTYVYSRMWPSPHDQTLSAILALSSISPSRTSPLRVPQLKLLSSTSSPSSGSVSDHAQYKSAPLTPSSLQCVLHRSLASCPHELQRNPRRWVMRHFRC